MSLASEMAVISDSMASVDDYVSKTFEKAKRLIKEAACEGKRYICFYDFCHPCNEGYSRDKEQMVINKLKQNGFEIKEKYKIFGGNQISPYVVW